MYVYLKTKTEPSLWTVGFYKPDGGWEPESDHSSRESAAKRVHYLNGGREEEEEEENPYLIDAEESQRIMNQRNYR